MQHHTDAAVAETINLRADASVTDVRHLFREAWKAGVKGITVYRSGSRPGQILHTAEPAGARRIGIDRP
ncbi:hypothetical protein [Nocardia sp. MW-W600-9]